MAEALFDSRDFYREPMQAWQRSDIFQRVLVNESKWIVKTATNDDNDDGWPDFDGLGFPKIETWELEFNTLAQALNHAGVCRTGVSGVQVEVYVYESLDSGRRPVTEAVRNELLDRYGEG